MHNAAIARARFGARFDVLTAALERSDPVADAAVAALAGQPSREAWIDRALAGERDRLIPEPLRALVAEAQAIPRWVSPARLARASRLFRRAGPLGGLVLALRSLVAGYISTAGNKPLVFTGRLSLKGQVVRRLAETGRFVTAVTAEGGLQPGAEGLTIALRVRLMHAEVRRLLLGDPRWDHRRWGLPINQHDMLATVYLFSTAFVDGLRLLGMPLREVECDDYLHLWRYVGVLLGVESALIPWTAAATRVDLACIEVTNGAVGDDARALTRALLEMPRTQAKTAAERRLAPSRVALTEALCRRLIGDEAADALAIPRRPVDGLLPLLTPLSRGAHRLQRFSPVLQDLALEVSDRYWERSIRLGLGDTLARFPLPLGLS